MKLDDIPKKPIFDVPEGYFDQLPGKIQARISGEQKRQTAFVFRYKLQYIIPSLVILTAIVLRFAKPEPVHDVELMLASIETEQLVAYLNDSDLTTEDVIEEVDFSTRDVENIEAEVYELQLGDESLDDILDAIEAENM
ncbi:MAG TPA: hypothetical protein VGD65_24730 [Chryseosolibacter sp.]